jgi:hypothetical protein
MSETKEAAVFDPEAHIEAIAIRFDEGSETWQLQSVGTLEECRQSCLRARNKGCEEQMRVYRVGHGGMHFNGETDKVVIGPDGHGELQRDYSQPEKPKPQPSNPLRPEWEYVYQDGDGVVRNET